VRGGGGGPNSTSSSSSAGAVERGIEQRVAAVGVMTRETQGLREGQRVFLQNDVQEPGAIFWGSETFNVLYEVVEGDRVTAWRSVVVASNAVGHAFEAVAVSKAETDRELG